MSGKMDNIEKKTERLTKKLISEEWIAANLYEQMVLACAPDEKYIIQDIFLDISQEERVDHYAKLVQFAQENGFDVPCKMSELERYASEKSVKLFEKWSKGKNADYYIGLAIESEQDAIKSYSEVLQDESVCECLKRVVLEMYYDEIEHLSNLNTMLLAYGVKAKLEL